MKKNGITLKEFERRNYTDKEIEESKIRVDFLRSLIKLRNDNKISQKQLEKLSGIKQPMIARIESGETIPRIDTILKMLKPIGMTLKIVPIENN